jgi:pimeloyl-ACP methyl ester carboxylesterase
MIRDGDGPMTFVLVHGGGHGGWCWQRTAEVLRQRCHDVWTPTLTGFGERHHLDDGRVTFATFVTDLGAVLEFEVLHDVVLVGHSMGGAGHDLIITKPVETAAALLAVS